MLIKDSKLKTGVSKVLFQLLHFHRIFINWDKSLINQGKPNKIVWYVDKVLKKHKNDW